ncbi:MAG: lysophospholipid acyltransferase family protein [Oscillospiraceae bacterium]
MFYFLLRKIVLLIYKLVYNLSFEGLENIDNSKACVYASNHRSYADPVLITLPVKKKFSYMAKEELFKNPFFSALIRAFGAFPVVRGKGDMEVINTAIEKLKSGRNLVIFPEGTRSKDGKVGKGKTGVALIASKSNADVIPVGIVFEGEKLHFRSKVVVKYGKPINAHEIALPENPTARDLKPVKHKIMASITELVEGQH